MTILFELVAVGVLILLNAFFVAAEFAMVKVRGTRLEELAETIGTNDQLRRAPDYRTLHLADLRRSILESARHAGGPPAAR